MLYIIWYLAAGLLTIYGVAFMHLVQAEMKGYAALDWWADNGDYINQAADPTAFVLGVIIWPVRCYEFCVQTVPELYSLYDLK